MNLTIPKYFSVFAIPISILLMIIVFVNTAFFERLPPEIGIYVTIDIVITLPFLYYYLIHY